jgi:hypothetical protein
MLGESGLFMRMLFVPAFILLAACSAVGTDAEVDGGITVPGLNASAHTEKNGPQFVLVGLEEKLPEDFIGCLEETEACYVMAREVDTELRFEPQSGRYWFMDPGSGNTYYFDGELRTGDPALVVAPTDEAELPPGEEPADHTGTDEDDADAEEDTGADAEAGEEV